MKRQHGFTLIELVMVIVILGVLAAVAVPKFIDLKSDAQLASVQGVAGAAASAAAINYAGCALATAASAPAKCKVVNSCDSVKQVMQGGAWPAGDTVAVASGGTELGNAASSNGATNACTVTLTGFATTVNFEMIGAGN